ncbi:hypothetical protein VIGAN_06255900 [Vigna angularis var. angularis]|uniref:Uncharacterized protein n=1 Tax=Vigna angularis var. angularis TaxID=157739 RepID=A0A0S3SEM4_PHAAN|nr:hypothetical protein VIGAN_06255900 [Vigna angularis var. angularis]
MNLCLKVNMSMTQLFTKANCLKASVSDFFNWGYSRDNRENVGVREMKEKGLRGMRKVMIGRRYFCHCNRRFVIFADDMEGVVEPLRVAGFSLEGLRRRIGLSHTQQSE